MFCIAGKFTDLPNLSVTALHYYPAVKLFPKDEKMYSISVVKYLLPSVA